MPNFFMPLQQGKVRFKMAARLNYESETKQRTLAGRMLVDMVDILGKCALNGIAGQSGGRAAGVPDTAACTLRDCFILKKEDIVRFELEIIEVGEG